MKKRILAVLLAVVLLLSTFSALSYTELDELTRGKVLSNTSIYEMDSTRSRVLGKVAAGKQVLLLWEVEGYYYVAYGNVCGFMRAKYVRPDTDVVNAETYAQINASTRLYKSNSTKKGSLARLSKGDWVLLLSETQSYYRVMQENKVGYVLKKYVDLLPDRVSVGEVMNTIYTTHDEKIVMELGQFSDGDGSYLFIDVNEGEYEWYGMLSDMDDAGEDGLSLTFASDSDRSTVVVEWSSREAMDFPVVKKGKNTGKLPSAMFTDYAYAYKLTESN